MFLLKDFCIVCTVQIQIGLYIYEEINNFEDTVACMIVTSCPTAETAALQIIVADCQTVLTSDPRWAQTENMRRSQPLGEI